MMVFRLRVKRGFRDLEADCYRPTGEVFEVTEQRAREILAAGVAEVLEVLAAPVAVSSPAPEKPPENPPKPRRGRRRKG